MRLFEIAYKRFSKWKETSPTSIEFDVDGEMWMATLSGGVANQHFIRGIIACGPINQDVTGELQTVGLSPQQKVRQALTGFHTTAQWLISLAKKYPNAAINLSIMPLGDKRARIYQQIMDQLQSEIPGLEIRNTGVHTDEFSKDAYLLTREGHFPQASFPKGAWG